MPRPNKGTHHDPTRSLLGPHPALRSPSPHIPSTPPTNNTPSTLRRSPDTRRQTAFKVGPAPKPTPETNKPLPAPPSTFTLTLPKCPKHDFRISHISTRNLLTSRTYKLHVTFSDGVFSEYEVDGEFEKLPSDVVFAKDGSMRFVHERAKECERWGLGAEEELVDHWEVGKEGARRKRRSKRRPRMVVEEK